MLEICVAEVRKLAERLPGIRGAFAPVFAFVVQGIQKFFAYTRMVCLARPGVSFSANRFDSPRVVTIVFPASQI
jgi:hypothetical protein